MDDGRAQQLAGTVLGSASSAFPAFGPVRRIMSPHRIGLKLRSTTNAHCQKQARSSLSCISDAHKYTQNTNRHNDPDSDMYKAE